VIYRALTGQEPLDPTERQDSVVNGEPDPFNFKVDRKTL